MILLGPVFRRELLQASRQKRLFILRTLYGLILLGMIYWIVFQGFVYGGDWRGDVSSQQMILIGQAIFGTISAVQLVGVMALTPAIVAGAIADEYQRKTMHDMLTSLLTGPEIVIDKLNARLLNVGVYIATSLPIISIITLFGGVDPDEVLYLYAITCSTTLFLASLSLLMSTGSKTVRDAVSRAYALEGLLLLCPLVCLIISEFLPTNHIMSVVVLYIYEATVFLNPIFVYFTMDTPLGPDPTKLIWLIGIQVGSSILFVLLAALRLRSSYARLSDGPSRRFKWARPTLATRLNPSCGEDPIYWKEHYFVRSRGFTSLLLWLLWLTVVGMIMVGIGIQLYEWISNGDLFQEHMRNSHNALTRSAATVLVGILMCAIGVWAAGSITSEREGDTWISLTATPLDGREIVLAKIRAALRSQRKTVIVLGIVWLFGLCTFSLNPFALAFSIAITIIYLRFAAALGVALSMFSKSSAAAQSKTVAILVGLNFAPMCCIPLAGGASLFVWIGPLFTLAIAQFSSFQWGWMTDRDFTGDTILPIIGLPMWLAGYLVATWVLTSYCCEHFDTIAGRPIRPPISFLGSPKAAEPTLPGEVGKPKAPPVDQDL